MYDKMYEKKFLKRLQNFGLQNIILSYDTLISIIIFFIIYILTNGIIEQTYANQILEQFVNISTSLFTIILAGLAIIVSYSDSRFIYAMKEIKQYDNMITLFQYNLYLPFIIIISSLTLSFIYYNSIVIDSFGNKVTLQGNLDPIILLTGGKLLEESVLNILNTAGDNPFIFNLGHGIIKETPIENVEKLSRIIKKYER